MAVSFVNVLLSYLLVFFVFVIVIAVAVAIGIVIATTVSSLKKKNEVVMEESEPIEDK